MLTLGQSVSILDVDGKETNTGIIVGSGSISRPEYPVPYRIDLVYLVELDKQDLFSVKWGDKPDDDAVMIGNIVTVHVDSVRVRD